MATRQRKRGARLFQIVGFPPIAGDEFIAEPERVWMYPGRPIQFDTKNYLDIRFLKAEDGDGWEVHTAARLFFMPRCGPWQNWDPEMPAPIAVDTLGGIAWMRVVQIRGGRPNALLIDFHRVRGANNGRIQDI